MDYDRTIDKSVDYNNDITNCAMCLMRALAAWLPSKLVVACLRRHEQIERLVFAARHV